MNLVKAERSQFIKDYLNSNKLINLNILGKINNNPKLEIFTDDPQKPSGVLVKSGYMHFLYTESDQFIDAVISEHMQEGFFGFAGLDTGLAAKIKKNQVVHWNNPCSIYAYVQDDIELINGTYDVRPLAYEDAEIVNTYYEYKNDNSLEDIRKDIKNRPSSAVYVDDKPVCWVLVHEDDSMGIMYTLEAHRRKGLAEVVSRDLTKRILDNGQVPYLQIVDGNEKSHGLAKKCGFQHVGDCEWFGIITGEPKELKDTAKKAMESFQAAYKKPMFDKVVNPLIQYILMPWLPEEIADDFSTRKLDHNEALTNWTAFMAKSKKVDRPHESMQAWIIEKKDAFSTPIGAALIEMLDEDECILHDMYVDSFQDQKLVMWSFLKGLKEAGIYFVLKLNSEDQSSQYFEMNYKDVGHI